MQNFKIDEKYFVENPIETVDNILNEMYNNCIKLATIILPYYPIGEDIDMITYRLDQIQDAAHAAFKNKKQN